MAFNFLGLPRAYIYAWVEESHYNRLFLGRYKSVASQAVGLVHLYIGFQFGTFYSQEYSHGYQNTGPKVEVRLLVAYNYSLV